MLKTALSGGRYCRNKRVPHESMKLSVVIPCYNEGQRLASTLYRIAEHLRRRGIDHETIVVDDGSTDQTRSVATAFTSVRITPPRPNRGKGSSVRQGVLMSCADLVLVTDADLSTPIEEIDHFLGVIGSCDLVIGSRVLPGATVSTAWYRHLLGRVGHVLISLCAVRGLGDTQCGFKLYRRSAAEQLFKRLTLHRFGFDFEILHLAQWSGLTIREEPVKWVNSAPSQVRWYDYPRTLIELGRVVVNRLRGSYDRIVAVEHHDDLHT